MARTAEHTQTTRDESPQPAERFTIKQAADILNVDKSYLVQLLDEEKIPFTGKGPQRYIRHDDLFAYKRAGRNPSSSDT